MLTESALLLTITTLATLAVVVRIISYIRKNRRYKENAYYQITKVPLASLKYDAGKYGEYLIYEHLRHFENSGGKFLFNILIPKENTETTEIDVLLICSKGLFVFESKNFSGWIFGNDTRKNWTQTLPRGRWGVHKKQFYNPIMQNASHIKYLRRLVGKGAPIFSIVVFSDRCTLMNVTIKNCDVPVINRCNVAPAVAKICDSTRADTYTETEINDIYNKLYPLTQFDSYTKERHTKSIRSMRLGNF